MKKTNKQPNYKQGCETHNTYTQQQTLDIATHTHRMPNLNRSAFGVHGVHHTHCTVPKNTYTLSLFISTYQIYLCNIAPAVKYCDKDLFLSFSASGF